jgi:hypothetical protein
MTYPVSVRWTILVSSVSILYYFSRHPTRLFCICMHFCRRHYLVQHSCTQHIYHEKFEDVMHYQKVFRYPPMSTCRIKSTSSNQIYQTVKAPTRAHLNAVTRKRQEQRVMARTGTPWYYTCVQKASRIQRETENRSENRGICSLEVKDFSFDLFKGTKENVGIRPERG